MLARKILSRRMVILVTTLLLIAGAASTSRRTEGAGDFSRVLPGAAARSAGITSASAPALGRGHDDFVQTIRVFIHPEDIYPGVVVVKSGKIRIVAENETQTDISVVVERVNPGQARQSVCRNKTVNHGKRDRQEVNVGAGEYVFYEESRPQQQGRIIVDPNIR